MNPKKLKVKYIQNQVFFIAKMAKEKNKERILKVAKEKEIIMCKRSSL